MIKNKILNVSNWLEDMFRSMCGRITPGKRIAVTLVLLLLFSIGSIYTVVSAIYNFGKQKGASLRIENIEGLPLIQKGLPEILPEPDEVPEPDEFTFPKGFPLNDRLDYKNGYDWMKYKRTVINLKSVKL